VTIVLMRKLLTMAPTVLMAALFLSGNVFGQQTPATNTQPAPAATAPKATPAKPKSATDPAKPAGGATGTSATSSAAAGALTTDKQKASYALGMNIAKGVSQQMKPGDIDNASLVRGIKDTLAGTKPLLTTEQAVAALSQLQKTVQSEEASAMQQVSETNIKEGDAFLVANKTKDGVVTLPSGLQYKIITEGKGPKPAATDTVVCNYRGTLLNGKEFDSSYKRGQPASFPLNQVIKGWTEGVQLMPTGSKWQFYIPPALAYGTRGAGGDIGPNATLIFDVELISIQGK
jgi:FKBP-type peptidyl-prolyl cis-trans isomerase